MSCFLVSVTGVIAGTIQKAWIGLRPGFSSDYWRNGDRIRNQRQGVWAGTDTQTQRQTQGYCNL